MNLELLFRRALRLTLLKQHQAPQVILNNETDSLNKSIKQFIIEFDQFAETEKQLQIQSYKQSKPCFFCKHRQTLETEFAEEYCPKHNIENIDGLTGCPDFAKGGVFDESYVSDCIKSTEERYSKENINQALKLISEFILNNT